MYRLWLLENKRKNPRKSVDSLGQIVMATRRFPIPLDRVRFSAVPLLENTSCVLCVNEQVDVLGATIEGSVTNPDEIS